MSFPPPNPKTPSGAATAAAFILAAVLSILVTIGAFTAAIWVGLHLADLDILTWKQCSGIATGLTAMRIIDRMMFKPVRK